MHPWGVPSTQMGHALYVSWFNSCGTSPHRTFAPSQAFSMSMPAQFLRIIAPISEKSLYTSLVDISYAHIHAHNRGVYSATFKIDAIILHNCTQLADPSALNR